MNKAKNQIIPYMIYIISSVALLIRSFYSFCWSDESFYFATSNRFLQGDRFFMNDWFPTQLVSLIIMPFHFVFKMITGSNDGVILYFRILYVVLSLLIAILIYRLLRTIHGTYIALSCGLFYQFYAHLNIATMSYYTLSCSFFLLSMLLIYNWVKTDGNNKTKLIIAGIFFALSVLALPTLMIAYFVAVLLTLIASYFLKKYRKMLLRILIWTFLGALIPGILVLLYILLSTGFSGVFENLNYVLSDEEHAINYVNSAKNFFLAVFDVFDKRAVLASVFLSIVGLICSDKKKMDVLKIPFFAVDLVFFGFYFVKAWGHTGFIATALLLFAIPLFFVTSHKNKDYPMFLLIFLGGMVFSATYSFSSMCDLYVLSIGHNIAAIGGICFIFDFWKDIKRKTSIHIIKAFCFLVVLIFLSQTIALRFVNVYRDGSLSKLTEKITDGPGKGLYTTKEHKDCYDDLLSVIQENCVEDGEVFFTKLLPWGYLLTDMKCASFSTWRCMFDSERLKAYYEIHPEKEPEVIVLLNDDVGSYETCGDVKADPNPNENQLDGYLQDLIDSKNYEKITYKNATVYRQYIN